MRELKFRAFYDNRMHDNTEAMRILYNNSTEGSLTPKYPIMQFTELKDKNGKEIYEGDIVLREVNIGLPSYESKVFKICWGTWCYMRYETKRRNRNGYALDIIDARSNCTVIGNIYENPGLLDKSE